MEKKAVYRKQDIGQLQPTFGHGFIVKQEKVGTKQHIKRDYQQLRLVSIHCFVTQSIPHCFEPTPLIFAIQQGNTLTSLQAGSQYYHLAP